MIRRIIQIDEEKCNGCGACATACHEGAIAMINGKAKLIRDDYCDGLGDCLPACPVDAITFVEREAAAYDEEAVQRHLQEREAKKMHEHRHAHGGSPCGCPGSAMRDLHRDNIEAEECTSAPQSAQAPISRLAQWPCQIKLVPVNAPFFDGAKLLIAADCAAYAYANVHEEFMKGKTTIIGCPKLDDVDYTEKLTAIITENDIRSLTVLRMQVPCCGGIEMAAINALKSSGKFIPWQVVTFSVDGKIVE